MLNAQAARTPNAEVKEEKNMILFLLLEGRPVVSVIVEYELTLSNQPFLAHSKTEHTPH